MPHYNEMERIGSDLYWCADRCWRPILDKDEDGVETTVWATVPDDELLDEVFTLAGGDEFWDYVGAEMAVDNDR